MVYAFVIEPTTYDAFDSEEAQIEKCREWGLLSEKASKAKTFMYKAHGMNLSCSIIGFVDNMTAVIEFENKQRHCIHPSYLKEMQTSTFSQRLVAATSESAEPEPQEDQFETPPEEPAVEAQKDEPEAAIEPPKEKAAKGKKQKLQLPEEKVQITATVKEFTTVPNNFSDNDDEVVIYEAVALLDPPVEIGDAWSSHSTTLKKLELEIGDTLTFEGKIITKKLTKHPVPYKINNPSKIQKEKS